MLAGCAAGPRVPDWQIEAHGAQQRAIRAELEGRQRVAELEWQRALEAAQRTARADQMARLALSRCAVAQASLDLAERCEAAQPVLPRAGAAEQAYARYLLGQAQAADLEWLPSAHRPTARRLLEPAAAGEAVALLRAIDDPLARLVAASVWLRAQRLDPEALALAVQTASEQGWRRPLLAWLRVQVDMAQRRGEAELAAAAQQRIEWLLAAPAAPATLAPATPARSGP
ncbi:MAG: hypothetical protein B7Y96_01065 [Comamonadaceae bacterium 32-67-11]|nr:MAG: hypothetical protein B7Y96_01065 [Comamonadaceae bacterium 32-67-11]